jgi:hypothetical protein
MVIVAKWLLLPLVIALLLSQSSNSKTERTPLKRLQERIDVVSVPNLTPLELAGRYTNPSEELGKRIVAMGSQNLFLFPDKTYIFTTVSDIPPDTISDKGTWSVNADVLQLKSDKDITWKSKRVDRQHIVVRRRNHDNELFLVGLGWELSHFEENASLSETRNRPWACIALPFLNCWWFVIPLRQNR